jgi:FlaA1/EpsC-like NDP-sugar epimerase
VYRQYDGYPTGHPLETAEWLATAKVVNGLSMGETQLVFNGAGCLAAQLIAKFKDGPGGTYIHSLDSRGQSWEDYLYDIIVKEDRTIEFVCYENDETPNEIFRGTPAEFVAKYEKVEA